MKTCSFRQAQPIQPDNIFCLNEPEIRYCITPCQKLSCSCCYPLFPRILPNAAGQLPLPMIEFNTKKIHKFVNGYQAILNCPVVSRSKKKRLLNMIVLTQKL